MGRDNSGASQRDREIIKVSVIGIAANILLASVKAAVGLMSHSIAIIMDAVNNLSDALSSVITIVGTRLAGKPADREHPLGHGRYEYLASAVISVIVLYAGVSSLTESVKKIIRPETPDYSAVTLFLVAAAVLVKILLGTYVKNAGERVHSDSLVASGMDAKFDAVISASTLAAAVIFLKTGLSLEAPLGAIISLVIVRSGIGMLRETLSQILGERVNPELSGSVKKTVCEEPEVYGAYDLVLHNYGPDTYLGSVHVEVDDTLTAEEIDDMTRDISRKVYERHGVILTAVGIYSRNSGDSEAAGIRREVENIIGGYPNILQTHGFYADVKNRHMSVDVIIDFAAQNRQEIYENIVRDIRAKYPDYNVQVTLDSDISD